MLGSDVTSKEAKEPRSLDRFFIERASRFHERILFTTPESSSRFTYAEAMRRATAVGAELAALGLEEGERVVLSMPNSPEFFFTFTGVILSGGVPALVNNQSTDAELTELADRIEARKILVPSEDLSRREGVKNLEMVGIDSQEVLGKEGDGLVGLPEKDPDSVAYISFTGGSTGKPKGVFISHANALEEIFAMKRAYALPPDCRHLCVLPMFHASALYRNVLVPFSQGSEIVIVRSFDVDSFWEWVKRFDVGFVQVVPLVIRSLLDHPEAPGRSAVRSLHFIGCASAPLPAGSIERFEERFGVPIAQGYGLTEATCAVCLNDPRVAHRPSGSVGRPIDIASVRILDESRRSLGPGKTGEIVISDPMIAMGFLPDSHSEDKRIEEGVLYTGDVGYLDEDGYLYIEGRTTELITRMGFKVSPREVEEALLKIEGIEFSVVFGVPHETVGEDVIAYVKRSSGIELREGEIRKKLADRLARYKIPSRILEISSEEEGIGFKTSRSDYRRIYMESRAHILGISKEETPRSHPEKPQAFLWGDNVYLRPVTDEDLSSQIYLDNIRNPDTQYYTYSGRFPQSDHELRSYWENVNSPQAMVFAICEIETDAYAGNIALRIDWVARIGEFGRLIFRQFQDRPYSIEAMRLLMRYAFEDLKLERLWGGGANPASLPTLFRLGFTLEGILRKHHFLRGVWRDQFLVGLLAEEYEAIQQGRLPEATHHFDLPDKVLQPLLEVITDVFHVEGSEVSVHSSPRDIETWDSLGVIALWLKLEERFGISISSGDMLNASTVGNLGLMIQSKLVE